MKETRRSAAAIMKQLIVLVKPLRLQMIAAIALGTAGYLCAIFLTIFAVQGLSHPEWLDGFLPLLLSLAVVRGLLHYAEQYCNHYIAFRLLAIIRHKVFAALRTLCPAKLEGREKGNLISILTTDIELLEVFYAHTISPIAIAVLTSAIMVGFLFQYHWAAGLLALVAYLVIGVCIPLYNGKRGSENGMQFRTEFGALNSFVLDSLRGLDETIQYGQGDVRKQQMREHSERLAVLQKALSKEEGIQRAVTNGMILLASVSMFVVTLYLYRTGDMQLSGVLTCTVAMMGSCGPTVALSSLSNHLNQTLASGERVLSLLEEEPLVEEIPGEALKKTSDAVSAELDHVTFSYGRERILEDTSLKVEAGKMIGIHGPSGSGKSTMLKLLMRFWQVEAGNVLIDGQNVENLPTKQLRALESYVTQETHLFHDSIANNIGIAKRNATREEIVEAAKRAALHDWIVSLPNGYDTEVGELGDTLSGGEKQRIGIARAFLHDGKCMLLDEPTSNLDALNEGTILKSLKEYGTGKTIVLVSHRDSTMRIADTILEVEQTRAS